MSPSAPARGEEPRSPRSGARGRVLVAVVVLLAAAIATSAAMLGNAATVAAELRARRDALCARYAALGGLALGTTTSDAAALVGPRVDALAVSLVLVAPGWCVRRASAACGTATRRLDSRALDPALCEVAPR